MLLLSSPLIAALLSGCVRTVGPGPDLGPCADTPDGVYTFGEVGIGTCLAGPTDLAFTERDGRTYLAVANADPYRVFSSGSVLLLDWSQLDTTIGRNVTTDVGATALSVDPFVGGLAFVPDRDLLLAANRYSEGATTTSAADHVDVIDISDPASPVAWSEGARVEVEDDPQTVVVDAETGLAFVLNITDHSISVIDTSPSPLEVVDTAPDARLVNSRFFDEEGALLGDPEPSSSADFDGEVVDTDRVPTEHWTLTWVDGTWRVWVPEGDGLQRWVSGGVDVEEVAFDVELSASTSGDVVGEVRDPFLATTEGILTMFFADAGVIRLSYWDVSEAEWTWADAETEALAGSDSADRWDHLVSGPCVLSLDGVPTMFYEGRETEDGEAAIGVATSADGVSFDRDGEVIVAPPDGYVSVGDPYVRDDGLTHTLRMWVSLYDGARWSIGLTESADRGATWSDVEPVLDAEGEDFAAPAVSYVNGRYVMWFTHGDGATWSHATAWSWDGRAWYDVADQIVSDQPYDLDDPPRLALQADATGAWRVEGEQIGQLGEPAIAGAGYLAGDLGFLFQVASGHHIGPDDLDGAGPGGVAPGSVLEADGAQRMYVTTWDDDGVASIAALVEDGGDWDVAAADLIPAGTGGNENGAADPVVVEVDGGFVMFYAASAEDGVWRIRRATSEDGLAFSPDGGEIVASDEGWDSVEQRPHSVERLDDGSLRLWYAGSNGSRFRIGSALSTDGGATFTPEPTEEFAWQFNTGEPGQFDDSGVRDPMVVTDGDVLRLWYAGYDGERWALGYAERPVAGGEWTRRTDPVTEDTLPVLESLPQSFSAGGVERPVIVASGDGGFQGWYAGWDGAKYRVGRVIGDTDTLFPAHRFPTPNDRLEFDTLAGTSGQSVISLVRIVEDFETSGIGASAMRLDEARGMLWVTSKFANYIYVVDVRDDSTDTWVDVNYLDIEALVAVHTTTGPRGLRDVVPRPGTDLVYAVATGPDALLVLDVADITDDDTTELYNEEAIAALPLPYSEDDAGNTTYTGSQDLGGGSAALSADGTRLWVPHFTDNSVSVFALDLGVYGEEIARIPYIGENPWMVRLSPDGRHAVVANYTGEVDDRTASSTLAVIDADPTSPTYLEAVTWITNR